MTKNEWVKERRVIGAVAMASIASATLGCGDGEAMLEASTLGHGDSGLIGGTQAQEDQYRSTVKMPNCTAAKVGERHFLLAAHCVDDLDGTVSSFYSSGSVINVTNDIVLDGTETYVSLTIVDTQIHPTWTASCAPPCPVNVLSPQFPPDLAVIQVEELTPGIPEALVDLTPVAVGDAIVETGYGCELGLNQGGPDPARFKLQAAGTLAFDALLHEGSFVAEADADDIGASYVITPGQSAIPDSSSLCFGDSGGPLYRENQDPPPLPEWWQDNDNDTQTLPDLLVVGVNAYYTFPVAPADISQTDWHTRLDTESRHDVADWLQDQGVNIAPGDTPTSPCDGLCESPLPFDYTVGYLGPGESCHESTQTLDTGLCGEVTTRVLSVNGEEVSCNSESFPLPPPRAGGYCLQASDGDHSWAWFAAWDQ